MVENEYRHVEREAGPDPSQLHEQEREHTAHVDAGSTEEVLRDLWRAVRAMRFDLADIRIDVIGNRLQPHGPKHGGNLDERLLALTKSAASLGLVCIGQIIQIFL